MGCVTRQPPLPPAPPLYVNLRGALGFEVGATVASNREAAKLRGENLGCQTRDDIQLCTPFSMPGEPGYYTVVIAGDTVHNVNFQLMSWPQVSLPSLEAEINRIATLRVAGPAFAGDSGYVKIWTNAEWTRAIELRCPNPNDTKWCHMFISVTRPNVLRARVTRIQAGQ